MYTCTQCNRTVQPIAGNKNCPYCGTALQEPAPEPILEAGPSIPPPPVTPDTPVFPERMKANRALAGRVCAGCAQNIELGQDVWNCGDCRGTMHSACYDAAKRCQFSGCPSALKLAPPARGGTGVVASATPAGPTKLCPYCRELIAEGAKKCRHCGEFLDPRMRERLKNEAKASSASDDELSGVEIVFGLLCGGIACILGIVWMVQGKKKGGKMVALALLSVVIWNVIGAIGRH